MYGPALRSLCLLAAENVPPFEAEREKLFQPVDFDFLFERLEFVVSRHEFGFFAFGKRAGEGRRSYDFGFVTQRDCAGRRRETTPKDFCSETGGTHCPTLSATISVHQRLKIFLTLPGGR
jgi:hypothetical protein